MPQRTNGTSNAGEERLAERRVFRLDGKTWDAFVAALTRAAASSWRLNGCFATFRVQGHPGCHRQSSEGVRRPPLRHRLAYLNGVFEIDGTSCDTPRSAMVTRTSRFIPRHGDRIWVMMMKGSRSIFAIWSKEVAEAFHIMIVEAARRLRQARRSAPGL